MGFLLRTAGCMISRMGPADYDIVIVGGALAGAGAGLLLRRAFPEARVLIVEKGTAFDFKVGESTSEVAGYFLSRVLNLGSWLSREQISKNGLRFWFNDGENKELNRCVEIGPKLQVRLPAWQLDRSKLDEHVLQLAVDAGCELLRPATIREISLNKQDSHKVTLKAADGTQRSVTARWIIDASGKTAFLGRQRKTLQPTEEHPTASMWCRYLGVRDLDGPDFATEFPCAKKRVWSPRYNATNHIAGDGWWAWIIPLQGGEVSVGITWDRRLFTPPEGGSISGRLSCVLSTHPLGKWLLQGAEAVEQDARWYGSLAYLNKEVAGPRWVCIGDAAGFMDPLYSHGIDFIGHTVCAAVEMISADLAGKDAAPLIQRYAEGYPEGYRRWFRSLYLDKYEYIGDAELMHAAVLMDIGCYFTGPVQLIYRLGTEELARPFYGGPIGNGFAMFMALYNRRLASIARTRRKLGLHGYRNLDGQRLIPGGFTPGAGVLKLVFKGIRIWLRAEVITLWHRLSRKPAVRPVPADSPAENASAPGAATSAPAPDLPV